MVLNNPLGRLAESAIKSLKDPMGTAGKVVEQARSTAAFGRSVVEQVGRSAVSKATETAASVVDRATGGAPSEDSAGGDAAAQRAAPLRSVPGSNEPAHTTGTAGIRAERSAGPAKEHADPLWKAAEHATGTTTRKKATTKKAGPKKTAAKKAATPADVAKAVEAAVAEDPSRTAATPAQAAGGSTPGDRLPTRKTSAEKAVKTPAKKAARKVAKKAPPKTAAQVAAGEGEDVTTPVGTPAAGRGHNPDTGEQDLNQPGTEGILEESTAKAVASRSKTLRKAAERNPE